MEPVRTKDAYQKHLYEFLKNIYVVCPSCGGQAIVHAGTYSITNRTGEIKLTCSKCGYNKRFDERHDASLLHSFNKSTLKKARIYSGHIDAFFYQPLWLTIDCCNTILWAYNYEHLNFLEQHVSAKLRERNVQKMSNKSIGSRLPRWMTSRKNRETVLKAIAQLKIKTG